MKGMVMPGTLFEELGFNYIGPIDGHDLPLLVETLSNMKVMRGPRLLHVVTQKGRGYEPAEGDPCVYHGVSPFDPQTGELARRSGPPTYTKSSATGSATSRRGTAAWWRSRRRCAKARVWCASPNLPRSLLRRRHRGAARGDAGGGHGLRGPQAGRRRLLDLLQRAYDQLIHDVALQGLDVNLRRRPAGLVAPTARPTPGRSTSATRARYRIWC